MLPGAAPACSSACTPEGCAESVVESGGFFRDSTLRGEGSAIQRLQTSPPAHTAHGLLEENSLGHAVKRRSPAQPGSEKPSKDR